MISIRANGRVPWMNTFSFTGPSASNSSPMRWSPERTSMIMLSVAAAEGVEDRLACGILGQGHSIADVGRDVVAGGLEPELVLHGQGVPDHAERLPAADRLAPAPRRPGR